MVSRANVTMNTLSVISFPVQTHCNIEQHRWKLSTNHSVCPFLYLNRNGKQSVLNAKFKICQGCSAVDIMWYIIWSNRALFEVIINLTFVKCRLITPPQVHFRDFYCSNAIAVPVIVWCNNRKYRSGASGGKHNIITVIIVTTIITTIIIITSHHHPYHCYDHQLSIVW